MRIFIIELPKIQFLLKTEKFQINNNKNFLILYYPKFVMQHQFIHITDFHPHTYDVSYSFKESNYEKFK